MVVDMLEPALNAPVDWATIMTTQPPEKDTMILPAFKVAKTVLHQCLSKDEHVMPSLMPRWWRLVFQIIKRMDNYTSHLLSTLPIVCVFIYGR
jgi:hypothetical protein